MQKTGQRPISGLFLHQKNCSKNAIEAGKIMPESEIPFEPGICPGTILNNRQISKIFGCAIEGGIRKSNKNHCLVLIVNYAAGRGNDRWEGNTLYFAGRGQNPAAWQNRALINAEKDSWPIFLFELRKRGEYVYFGEVKTADMPHIETQTEQDGKKEEVLVFKLQKK